MKISEVTIQDIKDYAKIDYDDDNFLLNTILISVKTYIKSYTGLTNETMDTKEDLTMVLLVIANEMYGNREFTVQNDKVNVVIKSILDMHSTNLL